MTKNSEMEAKAAILDKCCQSVECLARGKVFDLVGTLDLPQSSSPETASAKIEKHLWDAIDLMAATLEKPDPRVWAMLDVYRPSDLAQSPAGGWIMAPKEPTKEMIAAGDMLTYSQERFKVSEVYRAMVAALSDTSTDRFTEANTVCSNCKGTKRALYFSEQAWAHEERDCHICANSSPDREPK